MQLVGLKEVVESKRNYVTNGKDSSERGTAFSITKLHNRAVREAGLIETRTMKFSKDRVESLPEEFMTLINKLQ